MSSKEHNKSRRGRNIIRHITVIHWIKNSNVIEQNRNSKQRQSKTKWNPNKTKIEWNQTKSI